uniref:Serosal cuticle-related protein 4 n=1 Tax=Nilaparvata lugens TaxID=108931 RepID=A0A6G5SX28_NILLU|nr:serosal cuticle-related protein 4 [Nilaparvata lugens]
MHIIGNVSWGNDENNKPKIWTMLKNAVTADKTNNITGKVVFNGDVTMKQVRHTDDKLINNINLSHIMKDSLMLNKNNQIVTGEKVFLHHMSCNFMTVTADLLANHINQENILEFNKTLVRKYSTDIVEGHKYFENGFSAFSLKTKGESLVGTLNNVNIDNIVLTEGTPAASAKPVDGCKTFNNPFKTEGIINTEKFNNGNFRRLNKCATLYDEPSTLKGSLVFENDVEVDNELWAQSYCIEGISINLTNAVESFKKTTGYKFNDEV